MKPRGWVVAHTEGGLGNRLRVLLGSVSYAQLVGARFAYIWPREGFGARMDDLWTFDYPRIPASLGRALRQVVPHSDEHIPPWLQHRWLRYIRTDQGELRLPESATPWERLLQDLEPTKKIRDAVAATWETLGRQPFIGVMIRAHATAHAMTKETSSVDWFVRRMQEIREQNRSTTFFLSCDEASAQRTIADAVPGTVVCPKAGGFNTRIGLQEAVTDLYLLASSSYLIGPYWSSFVILAHKLSGESIILETPMSHGAGLVPELRPGVQDPLKPGRRGLS